MVSALFSSHTLYLTLLSTPITPYRVFTPVNSAVAVPAESGTYQSVLEFLKNIELIVSCLLVCVVGLDEAGVGEGLPGQLALLPCLSPQLTLTEDSLSLQHITDELHLVYPGQGVGLDTHPVPHEDDHVLRSSLVLDSLQHPREVMLGLGPPVVSV